MAHASGNTITAADLNAALAVLRPLYGVGTGDRGYGQTTPNPSDVTVGSTVQAGQFTDVRTIVATLGSHQGTAVSLTPSTDLQVSDVIVPVAQQLLTVANTLDTNRLSAAVASMTLSAAAHTVTRASTWGSGGTAAINTTVDVTFASEDAARWFFNSGGELRIRPTHTNTTGVQNQNWNSILSTKIGTLTLKAHSFGITGTQTSSVTNSGFYELGTSATTIFNGLNIGSGAYASNDFTVTAQVLNRTGTRGGNGSAIRFVITFNDEHTGTSDTVASGTAVVFDHYRATANLTGIAPPTYTTVDGL